MDLDVANIDKIDEKYTGENIWGNWCTLVCIG